MGAQVLPATDVPPALEGQPGTPQTKQRAAVWHDEKSPALTRREAAGPPSPGKQAYGKWYVPPNDWSSVYQPGGPSVHKEAKLALDAGFESPSIERREELRAAERTAQREATLGQSLNSAYGAKAFKEHLKEKQLPEPKALAKLSSPKSPGPRHPETARGQRSAAAAGGPASPGVTGAITARHHDAGERGTAGPHPTARPTAGLVSHMSMRKTSQSPFADMELDEIISPDMRAAVRKTIAMNQMLAEHAARMKKYLNKRKKTLALASAMRGRGLEPKTPSGQTSLTAEFLMATSPSAMNELMTPGTAAQVKALVAAAHHLTTDGSLADVSFQPDSPALILKLPQHVAGNKVVKFSQPNGSFDSVGDSSSGNTTERNGTSHLASIGPQQTNRSNENSTGDTNLDSSRDGCTEDSTIGDMGDAAMQAGAHRDMGPVNIPMLHLPTRAGSPPKFTSTNTHDLTSASEMGSPGGWSWVGSVAAGADLRQLPRAPQGPPPLRLGHVPVPQPDIFSDRSLTPSQIMPLVPSPVFTQDEETYNPLGYMHLSNQAKGGLSPFHLHGTVSDEETENNPAASAYHDFWEALLLSQAWGEGDADGDVTMPAAAREHLGGIKEQPLALHVLGCMVAKARGLSRVAQIPETRPWKGSARGGRYTEAAKPELPPLPADRLVTAPPAPPAASATHQRPAAHYFTHHHQPAQLHSATCKLSMAKAPSSVTGVSGQGAGGAREAVLYDSTPRQRDPSVLSGVVLGLMNLSLNYLAGDRVPPPDAKPGLPPEARGLCTALSSPGGRLSRGADAAPAHGRVSVQSHGRSSVQSIGQGRVGDLAATGLEKGLMGKARVASWGGDAMGRSHTAPADLRGSASPIPFLPRTFAAPRV